MWFIWVVSALAVVYVALDIFFVVPGAHYGVHLRFNKRTGRIYGEGLGKKLPFVDQVVLFSQELDEIDVTVELTTKDKLQLKLEGSLQYHPDPRISSDPDDLGRNPEDRLGENTFFEMSDEIIKSGIEKTIRSVLGGLGGVYEAGQFVSSRPALGSLINSILRLGKPPHLNHNNQTCGVAECQLPEKVEAKDLIEFYDKHWRGIQDATQAEGAKLMECSPIEIRYGIDIRAFALSSVSFSPATKEALEKKEQAEARRKAFDIKLEMAGRAKKELGASAQEALNAADVSLDPSIKKQVVSVEGSAGVLGGFIGKLGGA